MAKRTKDTSSKYGAPLSRGEVLKLFSFTLPMAKQNLAKYADQTDSRLLKLRIVEIQRA